MASGLPDSELSTIISALRVAAEVYRNDADRMRNCRQSRLAEQFERQARECEKLGQRLEGS